MLNDFLNLSLWWAVLLILGLLFYPCATILFKNFYDKGYIFSKVIALVLVSYTIWLLASLKIAPFSYAIFIVLGIFILGGLYSFLKIRPSSKPVLKYLIFEELLFLAGLLFFAYVRGLRPDISNLEKFMDFGFVNSILKANYMPPQDMWFAHGTINYYYFGHFVTAVLIKISHIKATIGFNLMIATLFAFTLVSGFSLTSNIIFQGLKNIRKSFIGGLISALVLVFASNYHTIIYAWILPWFKHLGIYHGEVAKYYFADTTRFVGFSPDTIDKTINEFPSYSFIVSDLHAHLLNLPFVLTFLGLLFSAVIIIKNKDEKFVKLFKIPYLYILLGIFLGVFYMTNIWDFGIYLILLFILVPLIDFGKVLSLAIIFALPFILHFKNTTLGLRFASHHTPIYQFLILWGFELALAFAFVLFLFFKNRESFRENTVFQKKSVLKNFKAKFLANTTVSDFFILILIIIAIICLIIPEIVLVKDIYIKEYERANTVFKFTYQAYVLFAIASGYIVIRLWSAVKKYKILLVIFFLLTLGPPLIFPYYSIKGFYRNLNFSNYKNLDGISFLKTKSPDDYAAVTYLNKLKGQPVILEAAGNSYTDFDRISVFTGLPTVLGWGIHEWLWRGDIDEINSRANEIVTIYSSDDFAEVQQLVKSYDIKYVIIGKLESEAYKVNMDNLKKLGTLMIDLPETKVIKVNY